MKELSPEMITILEYVFKTFVGLLLSLIVWIAKDFKKSLDKLSGNISEVNISITSLALQDKHKEQSIAELKVEMEEIRKEVSQISRQQLIMDMRLKEKK